MNRLKSSFALALITTSLGWQGVTAEAISKPLTDENKQTMSTRQHQLPTKAMGTGARQKQLDSLKNQKALMSLISSNIN